MCGDVDRIFIRILDTVKEIDTNQKCCVHGQRVKADGCGKRVDPLSVCIDNNISDDGEWIHVHPETDAVYVRCDVKREKPGRCLCAALCILRAIDTFHKREPKCVLTKHTKIVHNFCQSHHSVAVIFCLFYV